MEGMGEGAVGCYPGEAPNPLPTPCQSNHPRLPPGGGSRGGGKRGTSEGFCPLQATGLAPPPGSLPGEKLSEGDPSPVDMVFPDADLKCRGWGGVVCAGEPVHLFTCYFWLDTQETDNVLPPGRVWASGSEENFLCLVFS